MFRNTQHVRPGRGQSLVSGSSDHSTTDGPCLPSERRQESTSVGSTQMSPAAPGSQASMLWGVHAFQGLGEGPRDQGEAAGCCWLRRNVLSADGCKAFLVSESTGYAAGPVCHLVCAAADALRGACTGSAMPSSSSARKRSLCFFPAIISIYSLPLNAR